MNPMDLLIQGGQGGVRITPSSSAATGPVDNRVYFGNSSPSATSTNLLMVGGLLLGGLLIFKLVK